ncbi:sodium:proton antiporter [Nitratiruptor sp. YY09-18]|uniref:cation:proton antiporter n=1 Tax=Nitratiruptor sp. YY09-18 TaxID=2724901 RepID=UPI001915B4C6|nr:sodium:proton antiporter [Nitratiruptor sp. YY09-18]BCD67859.1 monovalent cation:H+ antiporter, CPA1 family [Nitratiruptor sp. YY09-18]
MNYESVVLILFIIASIVAVVARHIHLPYTIALMAVGIIIGSLHLLNAPHLTQDLLYDIFLPPLIFEAAIHLKFEDLKRDFGIITTLVVPGVILSTLTTAAVMIPISESVPDLHGLSWAIGILFGAAVAATDPVAVVALFKQLGVPNRLRIITESESLLNDGTAIVLFMIVWIYVHGQLSTPQDAAFEFFRVVGLGLIIGTIIGFLMAEIIKNLDDAMVVITLTTVAAYGSFLIAKNLDTSGVMSTVATGLVIGQRGFANTLFPAIRLSTENFWEYIAFAMNSLIFLLMGMAIDLKMLWGLWPFVLLAYVATLVARFIVVFATWAIFYPTKMRFPLRWTPVLSWGGLRGALSMVLALSLPDSFAYKDLIVTLVFGVVLLSIFIQGLTMAPLLRLLGLVSPIAQILEYEKIRTRITLLQNSLEKIAYLRKHKIISEQNAQILQETFQKELEELTQKLQSMTPAKEALLKSELVRIKLHLLTEQKQTLLELFRNGSIDYLTYETLKNELDGEIFALENEEA